MYVIAAVTITIALAKTVLYAYLLFYKHERKYIETNLAIKLLSIKLIFKRVVNFEPLFISN